MQTFYKTIYLLITKSSILVGGQAVIEGVMMRVPGAYATAVRLPDGTIKSQRHKFYSIIDKYKLQKIYFLRGMFHLYESMKIGYATLDWSAQLNEGKELHKKNNIIEKTDPIYFLKSIKNTTEIKNMKKSHMIDGVALTKFLFWLKKNFGKKKITEISAQEKLENFRKINSNYKFPSFSTISGAGPNSAIIHYKASVKSNRTLKKGDLYLVDSGGQYSFGTTDVTRTVSLNNNSNFIKEVYTRVLKGHIAVSNYKINKNSKGSDVDRNARKALKKVKLDYPHGTGHGVGYFLNVHEGPQSFSKNNKISLKSGMIISNEPGYYKEGYFGIRIENLVYIKKNKFEELTMAPIEKNLIKKNMLNKKEIGWLNKYHIKVKNNLSKFMNREEKNNLIDACSPI